MAVGYTTWTVLNNQPIEKLESNLWHVSGRMAKGFERKMVVARRSDGDLVIFNPIALRESDMQELEQFGRIAYLVAPNPFHRQDTFIWKQRYPQARVVAPRAAHKAVSKAAPVELVCDELPADERVLLTHPRGLGDKEALLVVRHDDGQTVATCDAVLNIESRHVKFPMSMLLAPLDTVSTPRLIKWMMLKDKSAWSEHLAELAGQTTRLIPGHGAILSDGAAALRHVQQGL